MKIHCERLGAHNIDAQCIFGTSEIDATNLVVRELKVINLDRTDLDRLRLLRNARSARELKISEIRVSAETLGIRNQRHRGPRVEKTALLLPVDHAIHVSFAR